MLEQRRQNCSKQPELSQKPKIFIYKKVYHDSKLLGSKYLTAVEVFPKEVGDFCESVWDISDEAR